MTKLRVIDTRAGTVQTATLTDRGGSPVVLPAYSRLALSRDGTGNVWCVGSEGLFLVTNTGLREGPWEELWRPSQFCYREQCSALAKLAVTAVLCVWASRSNAFRQVLLDAPPTFARKLCRIVLSSLVRGVAAIRQRPLGG